MKKRNVVLGGLLLAAWGSITVNAADLVPTKLMSMELARDIAQKTVEACRAQGYQVAAVVVDRGGEPQVVFRDVYANRFNVEIATRKANTSILSGANSSEIRKRAATFAPNSIPSTASSSWTAAYPSAPAGNWSVRSA